MKSAVIKKDGIAVIEKAEIADNFITRFKGLMFVKSIPDDYGLLIRPCNQIHMFNMKFPLDIIYVSKEGEVVHIDADIQPGKVGKTIKKAAYVIEVNSGICAKQGICVGDFLTEAES